MIEREFCLQLWERIFCFMCVGSKMQCTPICKLSDPINITVVFFLFFCFFQFKSRDYTHEFFELVLQ